MSPPTNRVSLEYLDSIRGLASLYVVLGHAFVGLDLSNLHWLANALAIVFNHGKLAVALFIVLSGYCLMLPVAKSGTFALPGGFISYLSRRARRIYPPYLMAMALSMAVIAIIPEEVAQRSFWFTTFLPAFSGKNLVAHLFLFHNLDNAWIFKINAPFWSVATEWQIYFLFPLVLLPVAKKIGIGWTIPIGAGLALAPILLFRRFETAAPWFLSLFAMGMVSAFLTQRGASGYSNFKPCRMRPSRFFALLSLFASACTAIFLTVSNRTPLAHNWKILFASQMIWGIAVASGLVWLALGSSTLVQATRTVLLWEPLLKMGKFSYSLYLTHALPVCATVIALSYVSPALSGTANFLLALGLGALSSILFAFVFYLPFEKPFVSRNRVFALRTSGRPVATVSAPASSLIP